MIAVAFLPVLVLEGQEGKFFRPLAYTKNFAMLVAAVLALTLDPALRLLLVRRPATLGLERSRWQGFLGIPAGRARFVRRRSTRLPDRSCGSMIRSSDGPCAGRRR